MKRELDSSSYLMEYGIWIMKYGMRGIRKTIAHILEHAYINATFHRLRVGQRDLNPFMLVRRILDASG
jgi:hypothetical protein